MYSRYASFLLINKCWNEKVSFHFINGDNLPIMFSSRISADSNLSIEKYVMNIMYVMYVMNTWFVFINAIHLV